MEASGEQLIFAAFKAVEPDRIRLEIEAEKNRLATMPNVRIEPLRPTLPEVFSFEWVVFTDQFAVDALFSVTDDSLDLDETRVCSLSDAAAERLRRRLIHSDVIPARNDPDSAAESMIAYDDSLRASRIAIVGSDSAAGPLAARLGATGASIAVIVSYRTVVTDSGRFRSMLAGGAFDGIVLRDPDEVARFAVLIGETGLPPETLILTGDTGAALALGELGIKCRPFAAR